MNERHEPNAEFAGVPLRRKFWLFVSQLLVFVASVCVAAAGFQSTVLTSDIANRIDHVGRLRYLSQRVAVRHLLWLQQMDDRNQAEAALVSDAFDRQLRSLRDGDPSRDLSPAGDQRVLAAFAEIQRHLRELTQASQLISAGEHDADLEQRIVIAADDLANACGALMREEQRRVHAQQGHLRWIFGGIGFVVLMLGIISRQMLQRAHHELYERVEIERSLREARSFLRSTFDSLQQQIAILDETGTVVAVNAAWRDAAFEHGMNDPQGALGMNYLEICDATEGTDRETACRVAQGIRNVMERRADEFHLEYQFVEGEVRRWFVVHVSRFEHEGSVRIVVAHENVTANKLAELELHEAKVVAEMASRAKSTFLANMSHEIRTPMTAILGFADVLLEHLETLSEDDGRHEGDIEAAKTIKRNGEYLLEIINDILDLSKIEAGRMTVERIECQPRQIIDEAAALMKVRADAKQLPLKVEYATPIPDSVRTDPTRLRQILVNLVGNAIKFTATGEVRIVVRLVRGDQGDGQLEIDVCDTGIGMSSEQVSRLFRPFAQADTSTTRRYGGTGLGLTISKRLTEILGGAIRVESAPGKGSTFTVSIDVGPLEGLKMWTPTCQDASDKNDARGRETASQPKHLDIRVLLAEDGPDNQRLISHVLKKAGAKVTIVDNGQLAVEAVLRTCPGLTSAAHSLDDAPESRTPFDIVLMDMQMPILDGYAATRALRESGYDGPILALTANAMSQDRQKCLDAGCTDYATKPIQRDKLLKLIDRYAIRHSRRASQRDSEFDLVAAVADARD